jgi:hypothetical protein
MEGRPMYKILRRGLFRPKLRLVAPEGIGAGQEFDRLAAELGTFVRRARKVGFVAARKADAPQAVVSHWNGVETTNMAQPGDWIIANLDAGRETLRDKTGNANLYVIEAGKFPALYEAASGTSEFGDVYLAKGEVEAVYLSGGFIIKAPWGETQEADDGYLLRNGDEVYGNNKETFERTYEFSAR